MSNPLLTGDIGDHSSEWARTASYEKQERPMLAVRKIVVKGAVDVVFFRAPSAHLVVAGETKDAIDGIQTHFDGDKLVIEQEGISISGNCGSIHVSGSGNIVAGGNNYVGGRDGGGGMPVQWAGGRRQHWPGPLHRRCRVAGGSEHSCQRKWRRDALQPGAGHLGPRHPGLW